MKNLPPSVVKASGRLASSDAWIWLLHFQYGATNHYFASNAADIAFDGHTYVASNFSIGQADESSKGDIPSWAVVIDDVSRLLAPTLEANDGAIGATISIFMVNARLLAESYAAATHTLTVTSCTIAGDTITMGLGGPNLLQARFPRRRYIAMHCGWLGMDGFDGVECAYAPRSVVSVTLSGTDPVDIEATAHRFSTGDTLELSGSAGIMPDLAGTYTVTWVDANHVTLDGTDSSDYAGAYTGGDTIGYTECNGTFDQCWARQNTARFGGFIGLRPGVYRFA